MTEKGTSPYREQGGTLPPQLQHDNIAARFKAYLMALEVLALDLPSILDELVDQYGTDVPAVRRLNQHLARIADTSRL